MTTTDTRPVVHETWCNNHSGPARTGIPEEPELCSWERSFPGGEYFVNVEQGQDGAPPYVAVWGNGDPLTPVTARAMAAALIEAAALAEGHTTDESASS